MANLTLSDEILQKTLLVYGGKPIDVNSLTSFQKFSFNVFGNPKYVVSPKIQFTTQLDITHVYANYLSNYKVSDRITFATFVKWIVIKSMQNTPLLWRYINEQWYEFTNLPLEVTKRTLQNRELQLFVLENVNHASWETFCKYHDDYKQGKYKDLLQIPLELPLRTIGYEILNVHLPRMTSYNTTTRTVYAHQPWVIFSDRYEQEGKIYLPFYMNYSHVILTPEDVEQYIKQFLTFGNMTPNQVEEATKPKVTEPSSGPAALPPSNDPAPDNLPF